MSSLRRPVQRNIRASRSRCLPPVDFISIQREISRGVRFARVLRIGDRQSAEAKRAAGDTAGNSAIDMTVGINTIREINSPEESALILTPALRRGFSADQPAY